MKICIIGAGVAGLTLAVACQRAGIQAEVYERATELTTIGGGILLWPHGQRYLEWIGLQHILAPFEIQINHCTVVGSQGNVLLKENYAALNELVGGAVLPLNRSQFQRALVAELLPQTLHLDKQCSKIENHHDYAKATFADGSEVTADIIVGADGIHSVVREYITPQVGLNYTNNCWWGGVIKKTNLPNLTLDATYVAVENAKMCIVWPCANQEYMWYLPVKMSAQDLATTSLASLCHTWQSEAGNIIAAPSQQNFCLPIYDISPQANWVKNRLVVIGDAAHALGPILGQGASQAIEDAFVLLSCLRFADDVVQAVTVYDDMRHTRYERLYELEREASSMMVTDDAAARALFEALVPNVNLVTMYQELIPLIDSAACLSIANEAKQKLQRWEEAV